MCTARTRPLSCIPQNGRVTSGVQADLQAAHPKVAADKRDIQDIDDPISIRWRRNVGIIARGKERRRSRLAKAVYYNTQVALIAIATEVGWTMSVATHLHHVA